jgi:hypothetical protein
MKKTTIESTRPLEVFVLVSLTRFNSVLQTQALFGFNP